MGLVDQRAFVYLGKNCRSSVQMGHTCGFCPGPNWTPQMSHMRASSAAPSIELSPSTVLNPQTLAASWSSFSTSTHKWNSHSKSLCNPVSFWNKNCQMHNTKKSHISKPPHKLEFSLSLLRIFLRCGNRTHNRTKWVLGPGRAFGPVPGNQTCKTTTEQGTA